MNRRHLFFLLGAAVSVAAVAYLFSRVDIDTVLTTIRRARYEYLLLMVGVYPLSMAIRAFRWQQLLIQRLDFWRAFHITNIGYFLNAVLPFRLGEVSRVIMMSREQTAGAGLSALALERIMDLLFALLCIGTGLILLPESEALPAETTGTLGVLMIITLAAVGVVLFLPRTHPLIIRLAQWFSRPLPENMTENGLAFLKNTLDGLRVTPIRLLTITLLSLLTWASYVIFFQVGLYAFLESVPLGVGLLVTGFVALGIAAPSLPGAVGVFQAAAVLALVTAGYSDASATGYAWLAWIIEMIVIILGGLWGMAAMGLSFTDFRQNAIIQESGQ
jgi:uncharacterized protein (TIRG00374 family)